MLFSSFLAGWACCWTPPGAYARGSRAECRSPPANADADEDDGRSDDVWMSRSVSGIDSVIG